MNIRAQISHFIALVYVRDDTRLPVSERVAPRIVETSDASFLDSEGTEYDTVFSSIEPTLLPQAVVVPTYEE